MIDAVKHLPIHRFNDSPLQRFTASPIQRFNASTLQRFNDSTIQRFNASTIQRFNDSTLQRFNDSTLPRSHASTPSHHQPKRHPNSFWPIMIGNRSPVDTGTDARLIAVDRVGHQDFPFLIEEFRVSDWQIKERIMSLVEIIYSVNLDQRSERTGGLTAHGHINLFPLIATQAESGCGQQELVLHLANLN